MIWLWLKALILTLVCEVPLAWVLMKRRAFSPRRVVLVAALATLFTHPGLWFVLMPLFQDYGTFVAVGELLVIAVESLILYKGLPGVPYGDALAVSATINAFSYLVGLMVYRFTGWLD